MFDGRFRTTVEQGVKPVGNALRRTGITADHLTATRPRHGRRHRRRHRHRAPLRRPRPVGSRRPPRPARRSRGQGLGHGVDAGRVLRLRRRPGHRRPPARWRRLVPRRQPAAASLAMLPFAVLGRLDADLLRAGQGRVARASTPRAASWSGPSASSLLAVGLPVRRAPRRRALGDAGVLTLLTAGQRFVKVWKQASIEMPERPANELGERWRAWRESGASSGRSGARSVTDWRNSASRRGSRDPAVACRRRGVAGPAAADPELERAAGRLLRLSGRGGGGQCAPGADRHLGGQESQCPLRGRVEGEADDDPPSPAAGLRGLAFATGTRRQGPRSLRQLCPLLDGVVPAFAYRSPRPGGGHVVGRCPPRRGRPRRRSRGHHGAAPSRRVGLRRSLVRLGRLSRHRRGGGPRAAGALRVVRRVAPPRRFDGRVAWPRRGRRRARRPAAQRARGTGV